MRVLIVSNSFTPNNDALFACIARQPNIDLHVAYCTWREPHRAWNLPLEKGYPFEVMPGRSFGVSTHVNPAVLRVVDRVRPDVAVLTGSYTMPTFLLAVWALRRRSVPWAYWGEELQFDRAPLTRRVTRRVLRQPLRLADAVFAIGSRAADSYARLGIAPDRIARFHYYADADNFRLDAEARARARQSVRARAGIDEHTVTFLFCGQLIPRKGVDTVLRAFARVQARGLAPALLIVGDGPQRAELESLASALGIAHAVTFAGFAEPEALPPYFAAADAIVVASRQEGWGLVVPEAMAAGLPVLASDRVNAAVELIEPGRNGFLFPVDDESTLADHMATLVRERERIPVMSREAQARVVPEAPARAAARLVRLLTDLRSRRAAAVN